MNKFLFITHITPKAKRSDFRQALIDVYFSALNSQSYPDWKVIILGNEEKVEGKFNYFFLGDGTREEKFQATKKLLARPEIKNLFAESDYVIKLDDDDIISPVLLAQLSDFNGDLYYDEFHTFLDSSSGIITQQKRSWLASTCVHKSKHVLTPWNGPGASPVGNLLYTEHSKSWHLFYESKDKVAAQKNNPVYLRVLSPTSITSGAIDGPPKSISDVSIDKYYDYLKSFGDWKAADVKIFSSYLTPISKAWGFFAGKEQEKLPMDLFEIKRNGIFDRLKSIFFVRGNRNLNE